MQKEINIDDYTVEYCPWCDTFQLIHARGVTRCPNCGKPLAPCTMCESCDYSTCPYGCTGGPKDEFKPVTMPDVTEREKELWEEECRKWVEQHLLKHAGVDK